MDFYVISALSNAIVSFMLGGVVLLKNKEAFLSKIFALYCFLISVWSLFYFFWQISTTPEEALFWSRALMAGAIFIPITYLHFLFALTKRIKENKWTLKLGYSVFSFFFLLSFTPFFVESVSPKAGFSFWPEPGVLYHPFIILWIFCVLYFVSYLWKSLKRASGTERMQLRYIFYATIIGFSGGATNYFLWYDIPIPPIGNLAISAYIAIVFYAIAKYRFLDIRLALGRGVVHLLSFLYVIAITLLFAFAVEVVFPEISQEALIGLSVVVAVGLFGPALEFFRNIGAKYFHYTFYNYQKVLADLGKRLTRILDLDQLSVLVTNTLLRTMKLDRAVILLRKEKEGTYEIQRNIGFKEDNGISLVKDNFLTDHLEKTGKPLVYEELSLLIKDTRDEEKRRKMEELQNNMKRIEASLCLPLILEGKIIGMVVLGEKLSGDPYFEQDIDLLSGLASQASIAFKNAMLYSEVQDLSQNLEKKVDEQVRELKTAYKKLQRIDKAKTEFMSIVSHQLRTPLSIIKGQLSMLNEGVYDEDEKKKKEVLDNVYEANERLITLVNDVLNISRIQAGRVELVKRESDIKKVVEDTVKKMKKMADDKGVKLVFHEPEKEIPEIEIDANKIENALLNVVDNALKYTSKGSVEVFLKEKSESVLVEIKDTGEGMEREEIEKLFATFSRGDAGKRYWIQGSGLGLYIARQFVEMHGGKIWAESEGKEKGSQFYIRLPK